MTKDKGGSAFPSKRIRGVGEDGCGPHAFDEGMTLRDYFAAKAMQAIIANWYGKDGCIKRAKEGAYSFADAMLEERNN